MHQCTCAFDAANSSVSRCLSVYLSTFVCLPVYLSLLYTMLIFERGLNNTQVTKQIRIWFVTKELHHQCIHLRNCYSILRIRTYAQSTSRSALPFAIHRVINLFYSLRGSWLSSVRFEFQVCNDSSFAVLHSALPIQCLPLSFSKSVCLCVYALAFL